MIYRTTEVGSEVGPEEVGPRYSAKRDGRSAAMENIMSRSILMVNPSVVDLQPEPIPADWILSGTPQARGNKLATSHDWTSTVIVWDCTPGYFKWHYSKDEALLVLSGEAFIMNEKGEERRFGAGDLLFFPAGTSCTWRITEHIRKIAVLRETMWRPFGFVLKATKKLLRMAGLAGKSPLMIILTAWI